MSATKAPHVEAPGPTEVSDPLILHETKRAAVWIGMVVLVVMVWTLAQPLLLIFGGIVMAAMLDGGTRLLGRVLPVRRGIRLGIICLAVVIFAAWTIRFAGSSLADQFQAMQQIIEKQVNALLAYADAHNIRLTKGGATELGKELLGSISKVTAAVGTAVGTITNMAMILVIGIFIAVEPRIYERGLAWMFPMDRRERFYRTTSQMGHSLRRLMAGRLLGMTVEGLATWLLLALFDVPMAGLLGLLTGILAFLPNIGAIISGGLMILVGFSAGVDTGLAAIAVYLVVHLVDGYLIVPMVARHSVDMPPALILSAQLLFGALFGLLGLALADPIVAMIKVLLERTSEDLADNVAGQTG